MPIKSSLNTVNTLNVDMEKENAKGKVVRKMIYSTQKYLLQETEIFIARKPMI